MKVFKCFISSLLSLSTISMVNAQLTAEQQSWLDSHNRSRLIHQVGKLKWSETLAQSAQSFVNTCPTLHSNLPYGENMAFASFNQSPSNVVARWMSEEPSYNYQNPSFSAGHFSQVVWKSTIELGCAINQNCTTGWKSVAVCHYNPQGNYSGRYKDNVFPPITLVFKDSFE